MKKEETQENSNLGTKHKRKHSPHKHWTPKVLVRLHYYIVTIILLYSVLLFINTIILMNNQLLMYMI